MKLLGVSQDAAAAVEAAAAAQAATAVQVSAVRASSDSSLLRCAVPRR